MNQEPIYNVLFLGTGNSTRSIMAEAILNRMPPHRFKAYSAGSAPAGVVNPYAIGLLKSLHYNTDELRSKSWNEFTRAAAPILHFVFTVCDDAAKEERPVWRRQPVTANWAIPDPGAVIGSPAEIGVAFADTFRMLRKRMELFANFSLISLDRLRMRRLVDSLAPAP